MKPKAFYYVSVVIVSFLFGCTASQNTPQNQEEKQVRIHAGNLDRITGVQWILKSMKQDGQDHPLAGENPFIKFEKDGKVSGFASINRYFGSVQIDSQGNLKWSPFGATRMAGPENLMNQEDTFLNSLQKTEQLRTEGIYLFVSTRNRQTELVFYVPVK